MRHRSIAKLAGMLPLLALWGCSSPAPAALEQPAAAQVEHVPASTAPAALSTASASAARRDQLFVRQSSGGSEDRFAVLDGGDGTGVRELAWGLPAPDWSVVYTVAAINGSTIVRAVDATNNRALRETSIDGEYSLPATTLDRTLSGLSPNGKWLVLVEAPTKGEPRAYGPGGRPHSRLVVLDTMFATPARSLRLDGTFSFDAISNSGQALYLIEHLVPERPEEYRVRLYNFGIDALDPGIIADKRQAPQLMAGTRHSTVAAPDGSWLFSVYLNAHHGPFIHALNLDDGYALCIFLPAEAKEDWQRQLHWAVAMNRAGVLYAVNGALGIVVEVDRSQFSLRRSVKLDPAPAAEPAGRLQLASRNGMAAPAVTGGAAVSPDDKTLWTLGTNGLLAIRLDDFLLRGQYLADRAFSSFALSGDGERVYAVDAERGTVLRIDAASGTFAEQAAGMYGITQMLWIEKAKGGTAEERSTNAGE